MAKREHVASLLDLVKAFERIPHRLVAEAAARLHFNLYLLRLSLAAYRLARAIGVDGTFSALLLATRGITAGSGFATLELRLLLHEAIVYATTCWTFVKLWLYVDDLTITASGFADEAVEQVATCTNWFIRYFEEVFELEVSPSKSFANATRPSLARRLARRTRYRLIPKRSVKLLGTGFAGGRRRTMAVLKTRLKAFKERIPRLHALRRNRVDVPRMVATMGAPGMLYGVDLMGVADTHLHKVRVVALCAALPPGPARNVDTGFAILDSSGRTTDPAYAAHEAPVRSWCFALWQAWVPLPSMLALFSATLCRLQRLRAGGGSLWSAAAGPAAGFILTLQRLGWQCRTARLVVDDEGTEWDLLLLSPALVVGAVRRSVTRWRARRVAAGLPALVSDLPDVPLPTGAEARMHLVTRPVGQLLGRGRPPRSVPQWTPACRSQLLSAATGGQWPQTRLAQLRCGVDTDDRNCQLCQQHLGTLAHRRECAATRPPAGWPGPPAAVRTLAGTLSGPRQLHLQTRGLLAVRFPAPDPQVETPLQWVPAQPDLTRNDLVFHTDGSMRFGPWWALRRTGCAVVATDATGALVAYAWAVPPAPHGGGRRALGSHAAFGGISGDAACGHGLLFVADRRAGGYGHRDAPVAPACACLAAGLCNP